MRMYIVLAISISLLLGCTQFSDEADFSSLNATIATAQDLIASTSVGSSIGNISQEDKNTLSSSILVAQSMSENQNATQAKVDAELTNLKSAINLFKNSVVPLYFYKTSPGSVDVITNFDDYGTGTLINLSYLSDISYSPCIEVVAPSSSWGGAPYTMVSLGFSNSIDSANFKSLILKIKSSDITEIGFIINDIKLDSSNNSAWNTCDIAIYGTQLANSWIQVRIPFTSIGILPNELSKLVLGLSDHGTILLTDIGLTTVE